MTPSDELALLGGVPVITEPLPHEVWPPAADEPELAALSAQRNEDISIKGRSGPIARFEQEFLDFLEGGVSYAVTFNSGTSALFAAYFALGVTEGVEVVGPALTYHAALSPAYALGGNVVLADVDVRTRGIDPQALERSITPNTTIITVVHQWGHPCDMDAILEIADKHHLRVIEDCSHAHGSRYRGRPVGTFGDAAVFSLQANKAIFAGEGGILVTSDQEVHDRATLLGHYRDRSRADIENERLRRYWVSGFGLKLRMSPFNAVVASHSLAAYPARRQGRHRCLEHLNERLAEVKYIEPVHVSDHVDMGAWYGFKPLYYPDALTGISRQSLIDACRAEGMEVGVPSGPQLATLPLYSESVNPLFPSARKTANRVEPESNAKLIEQQALSLPAFYRWSQDRSLIDQYGEVFQKIGRQQDALAAYDAQR